MIKTLLLLALGKASAEHPAVASEAGLLDSSLRLLQQISEQCLNDTTVIASNPSAIAAFNEWSAENEGNLEQCATNATTDDCTLDSSTYATHGANVVACTEAGGVNYFYNTSFDCSVSINGTDSDTTITFTNFVTCIAPSCNLDNVDGDAYARITLRAADLYEARLFQITDSAMCSTDFDNLLGTFPPTSSPTSEGSEAGTDAGMDGGTPDPTSLAPSLHLKGLVAAMTSVTVVLQFLL